MRTVQISDGVKDIIEHHVTDGIAASEADFVEEAVRRYAESLDGDADALIAAANEGVEAIQRGAYTTISGPDEQEAFWRLVWSRSMALADDMRAAETDVNEACPAGTG